jgi:hypothetical protein
MSGGGGVIFFTPGLNVYVTAGWTAPQKELEFSIFKWSVYALCCVWVLIPVSVGFFMSRVSFVPQTPFFFNCLLVIFSLFNVAVS